MGKLRVSISDARGRPLRVPGLSAWLRRIAPVRAAGDLSIALVSDRHMRTLNREFRGKDAVTDVLSFPADPPPGRAHRCLGDIVIARGVARRQARAAGHAATVELRVLSLHGLLHLLGYDHDHDAGEMARVERRLRRKGGLSGGLIERS